jgi:hypothetical protein
MAKQEKDRLYYEITKEKPYGSFQMLLVGGSAGSVLGFLIASLVGAYEGMLMDSLVFAFFMASFLGFFFGALVTWLALRYLEKFIPISTLLGRTAPPFQPTVPPLPVEIIAPPVAESPVVENEETKGKSVDFVFPELSPDKQ